MQRHRQKAAALIDESAAVSDDEVRRRNVRSSTRLPVPTHVWSAASKAASLSKVQQQQIQQRPQGGFANNKAASMKEAIRREAEALLTLREEDSDRRTGPSPAVTPRALKSPTRMLHAAAPRRVVSVPKLSTAKSPALSKHQRGKRRLPPKTSNQWTGVVGSGAYDGGGAGDADVSPDDEDDERQVNAGVYVLENATTGHCYFGTTWDLKNAAAQSFLDLASGAHPHRALVASFQLHGADASGIRYRVLERVLAPVLSAADASRRHQASRRPHSNAGVVFDAKAMEQLLQRRLRFHTTKRTRQRTLRFVRRLVLLPLLRHYWPQWADLSAQQQAHERFAAAVTLQCAWRSRLARTRWLALRWARAVTCLQRFMRVCVAKCVPCRLMRVQLETASAQRLQRVVRIFLLHRRQARRRQMVRRWLQARRIQSCYRGYRGRQIAATTAQLRAQSSACVAIQRVARGWLARRATQRRRETTTRTRAAVAIQRRWRGATARQAAARMRHATSECQRRQRAAVTLQRVYWGFVARKFQRAAATYALQTRQAAVIRRAYRQYVARKFHWVVRTLVRKTAMAARIQRWFFFRQLWARVALERRERAAATIQRATQRAVGRRHAAAVAQLQQLVTAARCVQRTWRATRFLRRLRHAVRHWRQEQSVRKIQAAYRRHRVQRRYFAARTRLRREKAAVQLQCLFRSRNARREWRRRQDVKRQGPCGSCGDRVAAVFSFSLELELCVDCFTTASRGSAASLEAMDVHTCRPLQRLLPRVQRAYRAYQRRLQQSFGVCGFCDRKAIRVHCDACAGRSQRCCRTCAALFHSTLTKPQSSQSQSQSHAPITIEAFQSRERAAVVIQAQFRRFAQRHTLQTLRRCLQHAAAGRIQRAFGSRRQRRATRAAYAAHQQRQCDERRAAVRIQTCYRRHVARQQRLWLQRERDSAVRIQSLVRGRRSRLVACERRQQRDAATAIQRVFRGTRARLEADRRRQDALDAKQRRAAVCVQKHVRGRFTRQLLLERKRNAAAVTLQLSWWRWRAKRELWTRVRARDERQARLEDAVRRAKDSLRAETERVAATRIQALVRQGLARRELLRRRVARARQSRESVRAAALELERASASRIQRFVRTTWLVASSQLRCRVHCRARQFLSRRRVRQLRREQQAALTIQRTFRRWRTRQALAALAVGAAALSPWVELFDEASGFVYYYNTATAESSWEDPTGSVEGGEPEGSEPEWLEYWDENVGASYFYNPKTGEATWATPEEGVDGSNQSQPSSVGFQTLPPSAKASRTRSRPFDNQVGYELDDVEDVELEDVDVWADADTDYDINYKIFLTQLEHDTLQQQDQQQQGEQQEQRESDEHLEPPVPQ